MFLPRRHFADTGRDVRVECLRPCSGPSRKSTGQTNESSNKVRRTWLSTRLRFGRFGAGGGMVVRMTKERGSAWWGLGGDVINVQRLSASEWSTRPAGCCCCMCGRSGRFQLRSVLGSVTESSDDRPRQHHKSPTRPICLLMAGGEWAADLRMMRQQVDSPRGVIRTP